MADDRGRLEKLLGMLGSEFEGERANAALMIAKMAQKEGKTIADLCMTGRTQTVYLDRIVYRDAPSPQNVDVPPRRRKTGGFHPEDRVLLDQLTWAFENDDEDLSTFERDFAAQVPYEYSYDWLLSDKQQKIARRIIRKVQNGQKEPLI